MPDRNYNLITDAPNAAKFIADLDAMISRIERLDAAAEKLIPKLKEIGKGASLGLTNTGKAADRLSASLLKTDDQAKKVGASLAAAGGHALTMGAGLRGASDSGNRLERTLVRVGLASVVMQALQKLASELSKAFDEAREYAAKVAEQVGGLRDKVRELRAITGGGATTTDVVNSVKDLMIATGMKQDEAIAFDTMWQSALPAAKKSGNWNLNDKQTDEVKVQAARWAISAGISPEVVGKLVPQIGIAQAVNTPGDATSQMAGMHAMGVESVGKFTEVMKASQKLSGSMIRPEGGGAFKNSAELIAGISATSVTSPIGRSVQAMSQVWRELSVANNDKKAEAFKQLGIVPGKDDYTSSVEKIGGFLDAQRAKGVPELQALKDAGFGNAGANQKIIDAAKTRKVLRANVGSVAAASDPDKIRADNDEFMRQNPERGAAAAATAADLKRGEEQRAFHTMRSLADTQLKNAGLVDNRLGNVIEMIVDIPKNLPLGLSGLAAGEQPARQKLQDARISGEILKRVPGAAKRFPDLSPSLVVPGVNTLNPFKGAARGEDLNRIIQGLSPEERDEVMRGLQQSAGAAVPARRGAAPPRPQAAPAGGPVAAMNDPALTQINREQLAALNRIDRKLDGGGPAPVGPMPTDGGRVEPRRS
jgi:hypothetical protein